MYIGDIMLGKTHKKFRNVEKAQETRRRNAERKREIAMQMKCEQIARAIAEVKVAGDQLTIDEMALVAAQFVAPGVKWQHFTMLDEKPGLFGYELGGGWHWKLRQTRNRAIDLLELAIKKAGELKA